MEENKKNNKHTLTIQAINMPLLYSELPNNIPEQVKKKIEIARLEERNGNVSGAIEVYNECLKEYSCVELINDAAILLYSAGNKSQGFQIISQHVAKFPKVACLHYNYGTILYLEGNFRVSAEHLEQACSLDSVNIQYKNNYALTLFRCHEQKKAEDVISSVESLLNEKNNSLATVVYHNKAVFLFYLGQLEEALVYAQKSITAFGHEGHPFTWNNMGCFLYALEQDSEALEAFKKSIATSKSQNEVAFNNMGKIIFDNDVLKATASLKNNMACCNDAACATVDA